MSRLRRWWVSAVCVLAACAGDATRPHEVAPSLVVVVSMDTVRADRTSLYGHDRPTTPSLDALAREGTRFSTAGAQATQTLVSHKSIFSGKYPLRLLRETTGRDMRQLAEQRNPWMFVIGSFADLASPSLVRRLRSAGYRTEAYTDGGWMRTEMGFEDGFEVFDQQGGGFREVVPRAVAALERHAAAGEDDRLFLFVHGYDAHCPYPTREPMNSRFCLDHDAHLDLVGKCAKPELLEMVLDDDDYRAIRDHYDGGLLSADAYVGELLDAMRRLDLYGDAMVVVTSDHGESLGERREIGNGGLSLQQIHVPLVIKWPGRSGPRTVEAPVALLDVMPTVLDVCRVGLPEGLDGRSLVPLVRGAAEGRPFLVSQMGFREGFARITRPTKRALWIPGESLLVHDSGNALFEAYDLSIDPEGLIDLAGRRPDFVPTSMRLLLRGDADDLGERAGSAPAEVVFDEEMRSELEALGYTTE